MAALDVSVAVAHSSAAHDLAGKGRFARAVEKYALAANAGLALGAPDCLVVANAQARHPHRLVSRAVRDADVSAGAPRYARQTPFLRRHSQRQPNARARCGTARWLS